jgi:hypothetical protein
VYHGAQVEARLRGIAAVCLLALLGALTGIGKDVAAQSSTRVTTLLVPYTEYQWWLIRWETNEILCQFSTDHEGLPTLNNIGHSCGSDLATAWSNTPSCILGKKKTTTTECKGLYLYLLGSQAKVRQVTIELPPAVVWVNLEGCNPIPPENFCPNLPVLVLTGEEPLPDESILAIQGTYDGEPFVCSENICKLPMHPTPLEGSHIEFWAISSYGDNSKIFSAQVRVIDTGVSADASSGWYIDVISSQWQGAPLASCARIWESFPTIGGPPPWLSTPDSPLLIASDEPYYYLAGRLISQEVVNAQDCLTGGLLPNGYADVCGLEKARSLVEEWQNQFDKRVIEVAKETGVPAQLMKNLFAQESQFWPGIFRVPFEFGLGQITQNGADSILLWNPAFFQQFCPLILSEETCALGYLNLGPKEQVTIRGALALQAKTDCPDCSTGVDLSETEFSVLLFANTLVANCAQISRTIYNATFNMAGAVATYEDLWRFTVANYHAGPGCVSYAIHGAWQGVGKLTWDEVSTRFTDPCKGVVPYVEKITNR